MTMKRSAGGGRRKCAHDGGISRQKFECAVPDCNSKLRSDKLRGHYLRDILCKIQADPECEGGQNFSYFVFFYA